MEKRIEGLIDALVKKRDGLLGLYLSKLEQYAPTEPGVQPQGMQAVEVAGLIHDMDRHITNLHMELKRLKTDKAIGKEAAHA